MTCTICIPNGPRCSNHIPTTKEGTMKDITEALNTAADTLCDEGWTPQDWMDRNPGDGEDILTAITKATQGNPTLLEACLEAVVKAFTTEAKDGNIACTDQHWSLLDTEYPACVLVQWQKDYGSKWGCINLIDEAVHLVEHGNKSNALSDIFDDPYDMLDNLTAIYKGDK